MGAYLGPTDDLSDGQLWCLKEMGEGFGLDTWNPLVDDDRKPHLERRITGVCVPPNAPPADEVNVIKLFVSSRGKPEYPA